MTSRPRARLRASLRPESAPAPRSGGSPHRPRKKTKDQIVREERLALAARALLVPDPSPRPAETHDLIDWRAVMRAPLEEVVECIRCRGMHYMLAQRIQRVLRRIEGERNGELSLEFLRDCPTDVARGYLLSMEGYGVKTVSCILLLALYRADFPVDVNVGRIMARLGWVPLETEEALEELSQHAPEPAVYTFLRERLNSFGLQTLFELHYHMITLGKVFCEKRTPNCAACPLRDMCEYASSGGKRQQKESDHPGEPEPAPARARGGTGGDGGTRARAGARRRRDAGNARSRNAPKRQRTGVGPRRRCRVGERRAPPVGAPAVLLLDPGAGWAEARTRARASVARRAPGQVRGRARAARAFELVTAARGAMAPAVPEDDAHGDAWRLVRDDVVRVDADGEVVVGPRGDVGPLSTAPEGGRGGARRGGTRRARSGPRGYRGRFRDAKEPAPSRPDKGFARAAAEAAASHAASPLQLRTRFPAAMSATRMRHELIAWSLPAEMIPEALRRRAPDVDTDCYLAVRCLLPSALAAAARASVNAGCEVTPLSVLVPCRAAMYAKFPLHGTYFQTNELFLDARTAAAPAMVPARRLEFAPTVSVLLGSSVASICRGMSRAEVAAAFAHRAVCVRSWDADGGGARARSRSGRARSRPKRTRSVRRRGRSARSSKVIRAPAPGFCQPLFFRLSPRVRAKPPETGTRRRREEGPLPEEPPDPIRANPPPANAENAFESDEDAMDERWDLFLDREISGSISPRKGAAGWRTRRKRRRASRRSPSRPPRRDVIPDGTRRAGGVRGAAASRGGDRAEKEKGGARRLGSLRVRVRIRRTTQAGAEHPDVLRPAASGRPRRVSKKQNECVALLFDE